MNRYKYLDVIMICLIEAILCVFIWTRIVTKEILIDQYHLSSPITKFILYDLNTTIDVPTTETDTQNSYIIHKIEKYKHKLMAYTTSAMIFNKQINLAVTYIDGKLQTAPSTLENRKYVEVPSENVINFAHFVEEQNIPFMYVSTPSLDSIKCRMGDEKIQEHQLSERSWYLLQNLRDAGVDTVDLAEELADAQKQQYDLSSHWFPESALYAAGIVAERVNRYGFEFNSAIYYNTSDCIDYFQDKEDWKEVIYNNSGYSYSFPIPKQNKNMIFSLEHEGTVREGTFEEVFLQEPNEYTDSAYHGFSVVQNSTLYKYHNLNAVDKVGKKILIIGDSFNWILADYLITDIEYLDVIHNATFTESIQSYICKTKPDMVLIIYNDAEFVNIYTAEAYDFQ